MTQTAAILLLLLAPLSAGAQQPTPRLSTPASIESEFTAVPCNIDERMTAVKALFQRMGATETEGMVVKYKHAENFVLRKPGASAETIIVGAHYDKVPAGCGAIDNWTGIVAIAHLYRSLKDAPLQKTVLFVAFGNEEQGLLGSRAMASAIEKDQLSQYCAMINIDSLGMTAPQVLDNASSDKLSRLAENLAKETKMPFSHASVEGADADSSSFVSRKIPAVTIHGLNSTWQSILHSRDDQASRINAGSVYLGYRLALAMLLKVDGSACGDYR
ncbi:MAG: M28 family metallopeptidase [Acidobacteriota bacterium]|nr:M28 family metallopeptidase [Acidobacteriota bacterium]